MALSDSFRLPTVAMIVVALAAVSLGGCGNGGGSGSGSAADAGGIPQPPTVSCQSSSAIGLLEQSKDVVAYVPKGSWYLQHTGVARVQLEGPSGIPSALIETPEAVNSCAANSANGHTVCIANNTDVYVLAGTSIASTLTSAGSGYAFFSHGVCTDCTVAFDVALDEAIIGLVTATGPAYQSLAFASGKPKLVSPIISPAGRLGETIAIDSGRKLLLSPNEGDDFEMAYWSTTRPSFFENPAGIIGVNELDAVAEDCGTGIAVVLDALTGKLLVTDLTQATVARGTPSGSWSAPSQWQDLPDFSDAIAPPGGIAIAQGSHFGVVAGEIVGNEIGAFQLPATSGTGIPMVADWITCAIPDDPSGKPWVMGLDPHPLNAYVSPNTGDAMAVLANSPPTYLAVVDLTQMIDAAALPRTPGTHACAAGNLPPSLVSFVALP